MCLLVEDYVLLVLITTSSQSKCFYGGNKWAGKTFVIFFSHFCIIIIISLITLSLINSIFSFIIFIIQKRLHFWQHLKPHPFFIKKQFIPSTIVSHHPPHPHHLIKGIFLHFLPYYFPFLWPTKNINKYDVFKKSSSKKQVKCEPFFLSNFWLLLCVNYSDNVVQLCFIVEIIAFIAFDQFNCTNFISASIIDINSSKFEKKKIHSSEILKNIAQIMSYNRLVVVVVDQKQ